MKPSLTANANSFPCSHNHHSVQIFSVLVHVFEGFSYTFPGPNVCSGRQLRGLSLNDDCLLCQLENGAAAVKRISSRPAMTCAVETMTIDRAVEHDIDNDGPDRRSNSKWHSVVLGILKRTKVRRMGSACQ